MIAKKLFFTIVALGILFLPFSVVAADKNTMWQQLIEQEGCLLSSTDINYTISGSVFEKKLWKNFLNYAQNNKAVFYSIVNKFGSRKATKLHICNFRNATEGEVAVFVAQRIAEKNWYSYDGNNDKLKVIAQKKVAAKVLLLKNVIEDKEMCKELQLFFKQQYNLKNKISRGNANKDVLAVYRTSAQQEKALMKEIVRTYVPDPPVYSTYPPQYVCFSWTEDIAYIIQSAWNLTNDLNNATSAELAKWGNVKASPNINNINMMPE